MATQVKHRRGNTAEIENFTPAVAELVVNTDDYSLSVGDGVSKGGKRVNALVFDSVAALKLARLPVEVFVSTYGEVSKYDGRGSSYYVSNTVVANEEDSFLLANGNVAVRVGTLEVARW